MANINNEHSDKGCGIKSFLLQRLLGIILLKKHSNHLNQDLSTPDPRKTAMNKNNKIIELCLFLSQINMYRSNVIKYIAMVFMLFPIFAYSACVYKCKTEKGQIIFLDRATECPNTKVEVIHKETEEEVKNRIYKANGEMIASLIASNRFNEAREYAEKNNMSNVYDFLIDKYKTILKLQIEEQQRIANEQQRMQQQRIQQQMVQQNQRIEQQQRQMVQQQQQMVQQQQQIVQQNQRIEQQQQENSHPIFVPSTGKWCQQQGGVMNCW